MVDRQGAGLYTSDIGAIQGLIGTFDAAVSKQPSTGQRRCSALADDYMVWRTDIDLLHSGFQALGDAFVSLA
jgi:hypothetical protein